MAGLHTCRFNRDFLLTFFLLVTCLAGFQQVLAEDQVPYENLLVEIQSGLSNCTKTINNFMVLLVEASKKLHNATNRSLAFVKVTFVVPTEMAEECGVDHSYPTLTTTPKVHLSLGKNHPVFGKNPWTQQSRGCGKPGDKFYLPNTFLNGNDPPGVIASKAKVFVHEWAKYRWGVFEEYGVEGDSLYPLSYPNEHSVQYGTHWMPNYCVDSILSGNFQVGCEHPDCPFELNSTQSVSSSLLALPLVNSITSFCDQNNHDSSIPTKHNTLCEGKSVKEIYEAHPDSELEPIPMVPWIQVNYTKLEKNASRQYFLLIDQTSNMGALKGRWDMLMSAVKQWIMEDVLDGSEVGIVTFDSVTIMTLNATVISETSRPIIANSLPHFPGSFNSKRVAKALEYVNSQSRHGATVILIVDPLISTDNNSTMIEAAGSNIIWPLLFPLTMAPSTNVLSWYQDLASATGGQMLMIKDMQYGDLLYEQSVSVHQVLAQHMRKVQEVTLTYTRIDLPIQIMEQELLTKESTFSFLIGDNIDSSQSITLFVYSHKRPLQLVLNTDPKQYLDIQEVTSTSFKTNITGLQNGIHNITIAFSQHVESHWVEVLAMAAEDGVSAEFWSSHSLSYLTLNALTDPVTLFIKVTQEDHLVVAADVSVIIESEGKRDRLVLRDTGGGADITGNDAIYSGYWTFAPNGIGVYNIFLQIQSTNGTKTLGQEDSMLDIGIICCGSSINLNLVPCKSVAATFNQKIGTSFVKSEAGPDFDIFAPARVTDLTGITESGIVNLTFTAPGDDLYRGYAMIYLVWWWEAEKGKWSEVQSTTYTIVEGGHLASVAFIAPKCDQLLQYRVTARDTRLKEGAFSNTVNIILPCNMKPDKRPIEFTCPNHSGVIAGAFVGGFALAIVCWLLFLVYRNWKKGRDPHDRAQGQMANNVYEMTEGNRNTTQGHSNKGFVAGVQDIYRRRPRQNKSTDIKSQNQNRELPVPPSGSVPRSTNIYANMGTPVQRQNIHGAHTGSGNPQTYTESL